MRIIGFVLILNPSYRQPTCWLGCKTLTLWCVIFTMFLFFLVKITFLINVFVIVRHRTAGGGDGGGGRRMNRLILSEKVNQNSPKNLINWSFLTARTGWCRYGSYNEFMLALNLLTNSLVVFVACESFQIKILCQEKILVTNFRKEN